MLYSRTLFFTHSLDDSLHLLISVSHSIPPPWQPQICYFCESVYFLNNPRRNLMPKKGGAVLCRNWEHPEKLIKTFLLITPWGWESLPLSAFPWHNLLRRNAKDGWDLSQHERVKGSNIPQRWRQCKKRCSCWFQLHPMGQPLRNISKAKATYRKVEKMHSTTSLVWRSG